MVTLTVSEARATLPDLLRRVAEGEEVTITRHGQPVAVVVRPDALRARRADSAALAAAGIEEMLAEARLSGRPRRGLSARRAKDLVDDVHAARAAR